MTTSENESRHLRDASIQLDASIAQQDAVKQVTDPELREELSQAAELNRTEALNSLRRNREEALNRLLDENRKNLSKSIEEQRIAYLRNKRAEKTQPKE